MSIITVKLSTVMRKVKKTKNEKQKKPPFKQRLQRWTKTAFKLVFDVTIMFLLHEFVKWIA